MLPLISEVVSSGLNGTGFDAPIFSKKDRAYAQAGSLAPASGLVGLLVQRCPGLETANKIRRSGQPQPLQGVCSEAGAVPLIADDHDPPSGVVTDRESVGAGRIEPPLENVAVNDDRSWKITVAISLIDRPRVNNQGARCHLPLKIRRVNTLKPGAALNEQLVDSKSPRGTARI
jgi:hypothetical protein